MNTLLWLDDCRDPMKDNWIKDFSPIGEYCYVVWVKSFKEFVHYIMINGLPSAICFDHDLGKLKAEELRERGFDKKTARRMAKDEITGCDCAKWLVDYCNRNKKELPLWNVQSANPVGKKNIEDVLNNYK